MKDLGLAQIYPLTDDISDAEPKVICTSFADPYLIVIREDFTAAVVQCDASGDLDELEKGDAFSETKWVSGSLYHDRQRLFRPPLTEMKSEGSNGESAEDQGTLVLLFMLSHDGSLQIFRLPDLSRPVFVAAGLSLLLPLLSADYSGRRSTARERVLEILVADLGDSVAKSPYLILRAANDDLIIYEPFQSPVPSDKTPDWSGLCFSKICTSTSCESSTATTQSHDGDDDMVPEQRLRLANDIGGYAVVFQPGSFPRFLLKGRSTVPRVLPLRGKPVRCMSGFHTGGCERGFVYGDTEGVVRVAQLPPDYSFAELGWAVKKIGLDAQVDAMSYHPSTESYVLGASTTTEYELPKDDDYHRDWAKEDVSLKPLIDQGSLKVISPTNWSVIDTYELPTNEVVLCITTANLEVSEVTHVRKPLIAVGTCSTHAVDLPACGSIYIFDIIPVVPVPGRPETNRKLKLLAKEDCKGAITALSEVGTQGFLLAAQGQKCMVRGLKEDGSFLPVAFMDMSCYVSVAKCLPRSGMCLMGDAIKGLWQEEPYKMTLFGKSSTRFEVLAADFLPDGDALYIVVADAECNLHVLQFDPEHPKSLSGTHLLHHRTFHTGHFPSSMVRLPSSANSSVLLHTTTSGAIALLTPLPEPSYRRLAAVSSALTTAVDWACGLNPRAYRAGGGGAAAGVGMGVGAAGGGGAGGVLDGAVLRRWDELGVARRREIEARVGSEGGEIRGDLRGVGLGGGLGKSVLGYL
ncbi:MAG: mRNA cleavage and polyadenylation factor subunit [Piccolia ochrophora]|nr:MAG: mRNA cleavage and polyadenylation factor subunit [Piccolia ochrophora]